MSRELDPPSRALRAWPFRTSLGDFSMAATPAALHAASLGLEADWQEAPWLLEGVGLQVKPEPSWGYWYPGSKAPGWWRVLSASGEPVRWARLHAFPFREEPKPGPLWLRVQDQGEPCLFAPEGARGPGVLVTPDATLAELHPDRALGRAEALDREGWGAFPILNLGDANAIFGDANAIAMALGGYFMPGALRLDWIMGLALSRGVQVPGFPSKCAHRVGREWVELGRRSPAWGLSEAGHLLSDSIRDQ